MNFVDHFKGKDCLEIGCNAGLYGYVIAEVAKSYVGTDRDLGGYYTKQSAITKKYIKNPNVKFLHGKAKDFIKLDIAGKAPKYNAMFASFVLYHLTEKETDRIAETVLPKCDIVIIQTRTQKRSPWKNYNPHEFNKPKNVVKYLEKAGFKCETHWPKGIKRYAIIIGKREKNEAEKPKTTIKKVARKKVARKKNEN